MSRNDKILIVDDEHEIADLVEVYLKSENYSVFKFYNAADALACVAREDLSLAILDVIFAGHERLCAVPEDPRKAPVPHHHADGQGGGHGQDHGADTGGRRLHYKAVSSAGAGRPGENAAQALYAV